MDALSDDDAARERVAAGRGGREPAADPRPPPGAARDARARGARRGAALHGVARRRRRAARDRGRRGAAAAGGELRRLRGLGVDARAGDRAGARGDGARPARARGRGRRRGGPADHRHATARWRAPRAVLADARRDPGVRAGRAGRDRGGRHAARRRQRRRAAARLPRRCAACGEAWRTASCREGVAALPGLRAAASSCRAPGARSTTTGSSSTRCRCSPTAAPA